jgi:hypothetical protein
MHARVRACVRVRVRVLAGCLCLCVCGFLRCVCVCVRVRGHVLQVAGFFSGCEITHMRWMTHRDTGAFRGSASFRLQPPKPFPNSSTAAVGIPPWHGTNTPLRTCGSLRHAQFALVCRCGHVDFATAADVDRAALRHGAKLRGKPISLDWAQ